MKTTATYTYLWEYVVRAEHVPDFLRVYGPDGDWVRLFRRAPGYISTELLRDRARPHRLVTVDRWRSSEDWEAFRTAFAAEYEALDARCAGWTAHEAELGRFERDGWPPRTRVPPADDAWEPPPSRAEAPLRSRMPIRT